MGLFSSWFGDDDKEKKAEEARLAAIEAARIERKEKRIAKRVARKTAAGKFASRPRGGRTILTKGPTLAEEDLLG